MLHGYNEGPGGYSAIVRVAAEKQEETIPTEDTLSIQNLSLLNMVITVVICKVSQKNRGQRPKGSSSSFISVTETPITRILFLDIIYQNGGKKDGLIPLGSDSESTTCGHGIGMTASNEAAIL